MNYLFSNKFKKTSGVIFYLSIPIGLFLLLTERIQDIFVVNVFSIFSYEWVGTKIPSLNNIAPNTTFETAR